MLADPLPCRAFLRYRARKFLNWPSGLSPRRTAGAQPAHPPGTQGCTQRRGAAPRGLQSDTGCWGLPTHHPAPGAFPTPGPKPLSQSKSPGRWGHPSRCSFSTRHWELWFPSPLPRCTWPITIPGETSCNCYQNQCLHITSEVWEIYSSPSLVGSIFTTSTS